MMDEKTSHYSVLLNESINSLKIKPSGIYVDMTLGLGGHTKIIASKLDSGKVIAIDQDEKALEIAKQNLIEFKDKIIFVKSNFKNIDDVLKKLKIEKVDAFLYDLGTSYYQLTSKDRGFSYKHDKLDMRMDESLDFNAIDVLNTYSQKQLSTIFFDYGDVRFANDLAKEIINYRSKELFSNANQLNSIINQFATLKNKPNFNKIYQAIRIEVNDEINSIEESLEKAFQFLKKDSIISVITFHSLEDRIVKKIFNDKKNQTLETRFATIHYFRTLKVIYPKEQELALNNASRSAKLRTIVKIYE